MLPLDAPVDDIFLKRRSAKVYGWVLAAAILFGWGVYNWFYTYGKGYVDFFLFRLNYKQFCFIQSMLLSIMSLWCYWREKSGNVNWQLPVALFGLSVILILMFDLSYWSLSRLMSADAGTFTAGVSDTWISVCISLLLVTEAAFAIVLIFRK